MNTYQSLVTNLEACGFGTEGEISGADTVDTINAHWSAIAAMPDLLKALRECASMLQENYGELGYATQPAIITRALATIAKVDAA